MFNLFNRSAKVVSSSNVQATPAVASEPVTQAINLASEPDDKWEVFDVGAEGEETAACENVEPLFIETEAEEAETVEKPLSFLEEIRLEAQALVDASTRNFNVKDEIKTQGQEIVQEHLSEAEKMAQAYKDYEVAQDSYDKSIKALEAQKVETRKAVISAAETRAKAEKDARAKVEAMRAARAAGLTYAEYRDKVQGEKDKANAQAIAKAKAESEAKAIAKAKAQAEFSALIPRI